MIRTVCSTMQRTIDWSKMVSTRGNTQERERYYISIIQKILSDLGCSFESAGSQQAIDIRNVVFPDGTTTDFEAKSSNTNVFPLNDTVVKPDVHYIFIYAKHKKVNILKGSDIYSVCMDDAVDIGKPPSSKEEIMEGFDFLIKEAMYSVKCGTMSLFDFGELWKRTWKFGNLKSRPRPNWSLTMPYKSNEPSEEEPHYPLE